MTWTSPYPPIEIDDATLPELVLDAARRAPARTALIDGPSGEAVSYATLASRIERVAAALAARGFEPGDTLALWAPNIPPWAGVALAAMAAGGAVTGVHVTATPRELAAQVADAGAAMLVTAPSLAGAARAAGVPVLAVTDLLSEERPAPSVAADPRALALLPYSSGTTGLPKGVMLTHRNLVSAVRQLDAAIRLEPRDVVLALAPFAHIMGFVVTLATPLAAGATVVTLPRFDLDQLLATIERDRVTVLTVPPPVMAALAKHPAIDDHDLSSVEAVVSGGAPLPVALHEAVARRVPHAVVGQGYGLTETTVGISVPDRRSGTVPGSVGRLMASTELRVVDPATGADAETGELWVRGPQVMAGYLDRPDATRALLTPDGWLRTGDLGRVDGDGNLFVVDRLKELIKVNALQVAPAELEALLITHPQVADAAVVAVPDERTGEAPVAVVVPRGALDPEALQAWVAERVAPHKRIRAVRTVEAIPRSPAGKILRRALVAAPALA